MSESLSFKFTLTEEDFVKATHVSALKSWVCWFRWILLASFTALAGIILFMCAGTTASTHWSYKALPVVVVLMWLAEWLRYSIRPRLVARRTPTALTEIEVTFSNAGVSQRSALGNSDTDWKAYVKALESSDYFLLYPSKYLSYPYPKRFIADTGDLDRLRALIGTHVATANLLDGSQSR